MRFSRRDFLAGVLITGTLSAAATYYAPGGRPRTSVTLNFVTGEDPTGARNLLVAMWNQANPETRIQVDQVGGSTADQRTQMLSRVADGAADVLNLDIINIPLFRQQGHIRPLPLRPDDFLPRTLVPSTDDGEFWAAPFTADVGMLFARGAAGSATVSAPAVPLRTVIDRSVPPGSGQFAGQLGPLSTSTLEAFVVNVLEHVLSRNPAVVEEERNGWPAELEVWLEAVEPLQAACSDGRIVRCDGEDDSRDRFRKGALRFMRNWPVKYRELQVAEDPGIDSSSVLVRALPTGILGGQSLAVSRDCVAPERAEAFIAYLTGEPSQKILASHGLPSTSPAVYADRNLEAFIPHLRNVRGAVETARLRPVHPRYPAYSEVLDRHMRALLDQGSGLTTQFVDELRATLS
ncbi:extracellular solute-binding protein [Pseudonocardia sp. NPDC046786]|uniref:extracellular solute-binding protein n=1 Tax=Pseudonocardia sp. NPDC046786 TaxID=3155471 RepID=UPI0033F00FB7